MTAAVQSQKSSASSRPRQRQNIPVLADDRMSALGRGQMSAAGPATVHGNNDLPQADRSRVVNWKPTRSGRTFHRPTIH